MKKKILVLFLFVSVLLGFFMQTAAATHESIEVFSVKRTIHITYNKIFGVTDEYIFINTGNDPISSLIIEIPFQFSSNLATFDVFGSDAEKLTAEKLPYDGSNFIKWRIYLNRPLNGGDTVWIKTRTVYYGLTSDYGNYIDDTLGHIIFNFVKFPSAPYYIRNCSVTFTCDPKITIYDEITQKYLSTLLLISQTAVSKNNFTSYAGRYNLSVPSGYSYTISTIKFPTIKREIRIDPWGYIYVWEEHLVENSGPYGNFRITSYTFNIPFDAQDINVFDEFGSLAFSVSGENTKNITVDFDSTRYSLLYGETTYYWVVYRLPLSSYIQENGDKIKLRLDILFGTFNCLIEKFDIVLILPKEASLNYLFPSADAFNTVDNSLVLIFNESHITSYNANLIELEYDMSKSYFYVLSRPLIFLLLFMIVCSSYVIMKRVLPSKEGLPTRATVVPTPILLEFCSIFEEKVSLITELEKLDEDLKKRKIKKRIYRNQLKTAEKKILELNKDIEELKITIKRAGGRFAQIVNELEINEAERAAAKDGLFNLEQRYLRKKISVVAYQKLSNDLINRHKKARTKIDKLIFELREILS